MKAKISINSKRYTHHFDRLVSYNRWKDTEYVRNCNWTIFGLSKFWFSHLEYEYKLCLFGFELRIWMKRRHA